MSASEHYTRITLGDTPDRHVDGAAVADLIHLLAELVDNATSFSPPQCPIKISASVVGRGVAVEIEDRGLGIEPEPRARLNAMLAEPPDFGLLTLSEDARLGMFVVARLADRHGVRVTLLESTYGGVQALVLVPADLLAVEGETSDTRPVEPLSEQPGTRPPPRSQPTRLGPSCRNGGGWTTSSLRCPPPPRPARRAANQPPVPTARRRTSTRVPAARGTRSARSSAERAMRAGPTRAAATAARRHDDHR